MATAHRQTVLQLELADGADAIALEALDNHFALVECLAHKRTSPMSRAVDALQPYFVGVALRSSELPGNRICASAMGLALGETIIVDSPWVDREAFWYNASTIENEMLSILLARFRQEWGPGLKLHLFDYCSRPEKRADMMAKFPPIDERSWIGMHPLLRKVLTVGSSLRGSEGFGIRPRTTIGMMNEDSSMWHYGDAYDFLKRPQMFCTVGYVHRVARLETGELVAADPRAIHDLWILSGRSSYRRRQIELKRWVNR